MVLTLVFFVQVDLAILCLYQVGHVVCDHYYDHHRLVHSVNNLLAELVCRILYYRLKQKRVGILEV